MREFFALNLRFPCRYLSCELGMQRFPPHRIPQDHPICLGLRKVIPEHLRSLNIGEGCRPSALIHLADELPLDAVTPDAIHCGIIDNNNGKPLIGVDITIGNPQTVQPLALSRYYLGCC